MRLLLLVPGQSFVNSLVHNFWGALVIKLVLVMGFVLVAPIVVIYAELKIMAHMQHRHPRPSRCARSVHRAVRGPPFQ